MPSEIEQELIQQIDILRRAEEQIDLLTTLVYEKTKANIEQRQRIAKLEQANENLSTQVQRLLAIPRSR